MNSAPPERTIRVFVHLAHGFGGEQWRAKWERGEIVGLNEKLPYGYFWAERYGCAVEYSRDARESGLGRLFRLGFRWLLGFDFVHAWHNRHAIRNAEIVWTHTESQHLAVLLLLSRRKPGFRPKIIAQSVWVFDAWPRLWAPRRWLFASLMAHADVLTVLSPENLGRARALFPRQRSQMIPFGIAADGMVRRPPRQAHEPFRVLSLGNDRHRDWETLVAAVAASPECELRIAAGRVPPALTRAPNVTHVRPRTQEELAELYEWADLVALALKPNLHASGITVIEEATVFGVPVVCTDTGGLTAYFNEPQIRYVPVRNPERLREAIAALSRDDAERGRMVDRAQRRMSEAGLTSRRYAERHAELSRELVRTPAGRTVTEHPGTGEWAAQLALCCAVGWAALAGHAWAAGEQIDPCRLKPTFTEDFDTLSVSAQGENGSRWIAHTPWNGDFGDAAFSDPEPGFPFQIRDGILNIEARKGVSGKWQSGLLASVTPENSGFAQRFGYFEMRAQFPPGPGLWPAFWLNANQHHGDPNPGVEIDVIEYYGQFTDAYHSVVHVWDKAQKKSRQIDHVTKVPPGSLTSGFHTYGVDVEPDWITFYLDRRETWRVATPAELKDPLMMLVDLAMGPGWPIDRTPNPSVMKVDYVRAFAPPSTGEAAATEGCHVDQ